MFPEEGPAHARIDTEQSVTFLRCGERVVQARSITRVIPLVERARALWRIVSEVYPTSFPTSVLRRFARKRADQFSLIE